MQLVNHKVSNRRGPLTHFPSGQYKGNTIEQVIRRDPRYLMWAVKEWLDLSLSQALLFEEVTGGGIIPDEYIKEISSKVVSPKQESSSLPRFTWSPEGLDVVSDPRKVVPNLDFDPPAWWPEFRRRCEEGNLNAEERYDLYSRYERKMLESWGNR